MTFSVPPDDVVRQTRDWIRHAVIGLNLCPFAARPFMRDRVRIAVSHAATPIALVTDLTHELHRLANARRSEIETTLLVHPRVLQDFLAFNDFLDVADQCVADQGLDGVLQIASFHPDYRFAGSAADDVENATNRSPWPTLHLLREISISEAVAAIGDPESIISANGRRLRELGPGGWRELAAQWLAGTG